MSDYVRPSLTKQVFYDSEGAVIDYGNRWRGTSAPPDSYSVTSNTERYASLHLVADALIEHLATTYAVEVREDVAFAGDLVHRHDDVHRAVRVVPANEDEAPLTFVYTSFPGVMVHAGLLHDFPFPSCGCDACDESLEGVVDELEWTVMAVAAGGLSESVDPDAMLSVRYTMSSADGTTRSGATGHGNLPAAQLQMAGERLRRLPARWQPWSARG